MDGLKIGLHGEQLLPRRWAAAEDIPRTDELAVALPSSSIM